MKVILVGLSLLSGIPMKEIKLILLLACAVCLAQPCFGGASAADPRGSRPLRISTWYWLNSTPKSQWPTDFKTIKELGFTDVVLVWGLDAAAFSTRTLDSHQAIRAAKQAGLGSYLFVWHARHSALPHESQFEQVDAAGHALFAFDAFNPQWRKTQWKTYLQVLAHEYGHEPGMAGYVFDNSFAVGNVGKIDGPAPTPEENYLSYGDAERKIFGKKLPVSPHDPAWAEWTTARQQWWADWAGDTRDAIRAIDPNPTHRIVLEDGENTIDPETEVRVGLSLKRVIANFDSMAAYWAPDYSGKGADATLASGLTSYLGRIRAAIGPDKELGLSLRLSDDVSEDSPGHAGKPTMEQIQKLVDAALAMGVRDIDFYGYRMGVYHLDEAGWKQYRPGTAVTYPLTGQVEGKFIVDRPELWPGLRSYLRRIKTHDQTRP